MFCAFPQCPAVFIIPTTIGSSAFAHHPKPGHMTLIGGLYIFFDLCNLLQIPKGVPGLFMIKSFALIIIHAGNIVQVKMSPAVTFQLLL